MQLRGLVITATKWYKWQNTRNNLYCVEWDVKPSITIPYLTENARWCKAVQHQLAATCAAQAILLRCDTYGDTKLFANLLAGSNTNVADRIHRQTN